MVSKCFIVITRDIAKRLRPESIIKGSTCANFHGPMPESGVSPAAPAFPLGAIHPEKRIARPGENLIPRVKPPNLIGVRSALPGGIDPGGNAAHADT
jgi:hypothetical protein